MMDFKSFGLLSLSEVCAKVEGLVLQESLYGSPATS